VLVLGWLSYSKIASLSSTHRTHVSLCEAHGIPYLKYKSSNHGYPTRYKVRGIVWGDEVQSVRRQR
jgi:hypothetical protein